MMDRLLVGYGLWRKRRKELLAEAQERALAREARGIREAFAPSRRRGPGVTGIDVGWGFREIREEARRIREALAPARRRGPGATRAGIRWGIAEDGERIAELLELNGMPRWVAFEEGFVVAEEEGRIRAAVRCRAERRRLVLGLLVADPRADERRLARALHAGAGELARARGLEEIVTADASASKPRAWHASASVASGRREDEGTTQNGRRP